MSKQSLTTQPNKALVPTTTGQTPAVMLGDNSFQVVGIVLLNQQNQQSVSQPQAPQQSTTFNIQVNNFRHPPPEAPKQGHSVSLRDAHLQLPQTTATAIGDKIHGVEKKVPSALNATPKPPKKAQKGSEDNANRSRTTTVETTPFQQKPQMGTISAPTTVPPTAQMPLNPHRTGRKNVFSAPVSANQVQGQVSKEDSQPKKNNQESMGARLLQRIGYQGKENAPTSATKSIARGNIDTHRSVSGKSPTVDPTVGQGHPRPAPHNKQAPPAASTHRGGGQPTTRAKKVGVPHIHKPVNESRGKRVEAVTEEVDGLKKEDIIDYIGLLDEWLEEHPCEDSSGPSRLILTGKAYAEMTGLKVPTNSDHVDVVLDPTDERLLQIRDYMKRAGGFSELPKPGMDAKKVSQVFFGSIEHRKEMFDDVAIKKTRVLDKEGLEQLKVYVMDTEHAFDFELRRWADQGSDKRTKEISVNIAHSIWQNSPALRDKLWRCGSLQDLIRTRAKAHDHENSIDKFLGFCKSTMRDKEKGMVNAESTDKKNGCAKIRKRFDRV